MGLVVPFFDVLSLLAQSVFYVKVHTNPEVDSPFALGKLFFDSTSPLYPAITRPGCVSRRLLDEFQAFSP